MLPTCPAMSTLASAPLVSTTKKSPQEHSIEDVAKQEMDSANTPTTGTGLSGLSGHQGLKKTAPYWYPYRTNAKARWFDREILEIISTEFRDRSIEYYRYALQSGVTTVNGEIALPGTIVRNGDTIENIVHRHEPAITSTPVELLVHDPERQFIVVNKPGSIPVHAAGRYFKHSLVEVLKDQFGFDKVYTVNRLDRLTSGLMIVALSPHRARILTDEFQSGTVRKEYIARVRGEFPGEEITCEEPLLTVDRQMGLNIVHPEGKPAKTVFNRMHYDKKSNTSVIHCRPFTGRSHQIRVHLQYLGHPIANDAVYADAVVWVCIMFGHRHVVWVANQVSLILWLVWDSLAVVNGLFLHTNLTCAIRKQGSGLGKGGIDTTPDEHREAPVPPPGLADTMAEGQGREISDRATTAMEGECNVAKPVPASLLTPPNSPPPSESASFSRSVSPMLFELGLPSRYSGKKGKHKSNPDSPAFRTKEESARIRKALKAEAESQKEAEPPLLPRETGHDIGMSSPVPLSREAVNVITRLRNQKDEDEDWGRWRDIVFRAKGALHPQDVARAYGQQRRNPKKGIKTAKRDAQERARAKEAEVAADADNVLESTSDSISASPGTEPAILQEMNTIILSPPPSATSLDSDITVPLLEPGSSSDCEPMLDPNTNTLYCPECYVPMRPDPKPEKLYIFLHALRYTTESLGAFETSLPEWAHPDWEWEQS